MNTVDGKQQTLVGGNYKILTVTHKQVALEHIDDFIVKHTDEADLQAKLTTLKTTLHLEELLYVATCNRVIYIFNTPQDLTTEFIHSFFQSINPTLSPDYMESVLAAYEGEAAINHLFQVASSIDSLVIGEREILRQIRASADCAKAWGLSGKNIQFLIKYVVEVAKEVYTVTKIGEKQVSVVSLAIKKLLQSKISKHAKILLIGAGQTNFLVGKFLRKYQFTNVTVFNRSIEKAQKLAASFNAPAFLLTALPTYEQDFDCIIICTGATEPIITKPIYKQMIGTKTNQKLIVDLSIPNNVAREVVNAFDINYIEIEDLKQLAAENMACRKQEIGNVKLLLKRKINEFQKLSQQRNLTKILKEVPPTISAIKTKALDEVFKKELAELDKGSQALIEKMMSYMEKKCISIPMKAVKKLAR